MIHKKTIKKENFSISELYYYPKLKCCNCGNEHYGNGILKINIMSKREIDLYESTTESARINIPTDTGTIYRLTIHFSDIIPSIGYLNTHISEGDSVELVDYAITDKTYKSYVQSSFYNHLVTQFLEEFRDDTDSILKCPDCGSSDVRAPGYEITETSTDFYGSTYSRDGYYNDSENGVNINDVSILISHVDADNLEKLIVNDDTFLTDEEAKDMFSDFLQDASQTQPDIEW